jgi:signal transduction histidine kinase
VHKLLERQLRRHFGSTEDVPVELRPFLDAITAAYSDADEHHRMLQHSMETMSQELVERNRLLRKQLEERARLELELARSQKLESVGQLAAGIAHEINTPVQFVGDGIHFFQDVHGAMRTFLARVRTMADAARAGGLDESEWDALDALEDELDLEFMLENVPSAIEHGLEGLDRVRSIVDAMKSFASADRLEKTPVDLNRAIATTLMVCHNEVKYIAEVDVTEGDLPPVLCHAADINQVLLNLVVNGAHAIRDALEGTGKLGRIGIATRREGDFAVIAITDSGGGIAPEIRERVFDPFFTTKEVGHGTGQGLTIAHSIVVRRHGGSIDFESTMGEGTTFYVRLPIDGKASEVSGQAA